MYKIILKSRLRRLKEVLICLLSIVLASVLMFAVSLMFSSLHRYFISLYDDYQVIIEGKLEGFDKYFQNGKYYLSFDDPKDVYKETKEICQNNECEKITYNTRLLSLYGIGDNNYLKVIKNILIFILGVISISVFFVIYNCFKINFLHRKREIITEKALGIESNKLIFLNLAESFLLSFMGILLGFILSIFLTNTLIYVLNNLLKDILEEKITIHFNLHFILISAFFIFAVSFISIILASLDIKKYSVMDLFRRSKPKDSIINYKIEKNIPLYFALVNYKRDKKQYKPLIISLFIFNFLICVFSSFLGYVYLSTSEYVISPDYDYSISSMNNLNYIKEKINIKKGVSFRGCMVETSLNNKNYEVLVTDLGKDEVINKVLDIEEKGNKLIKINKNIFKNDISINLNGIDYDLTLNNKILFGFNDKLKEGNLVVNLDSKNFDEVCEIFNYNLILKTDDTLDKMLKENNLSYFNAKKARKITNNLILGIKLVLYGMVFLIWTVILTSIISILSLSMEYRKKYFSILKSLGFINFIKILMYESLNIVLRSFIYSLPFILLADKFLYECVSIVLDETPLILNIYVMVISLLFNYIIILIIFYIMHKSILKKDLTINLKENY